MIVINAIVLHSTTTVLTFGSNSNSLSSSTLKHFVDGYSVMEKIQMVGFFVQEVILSIIYIKETVRLLKLSESVQDDVRSFDDGSGTAHLRNSSVRKTMYQLLTINVIIIAMDLALLGVEFANLYLIETTLKGVVYSIKLKLEFAVLGKLVQLVRDRTDSDQSRAQQSSQERRGLSAALTLEKTSSGKTGRGSGIGRLKMGSLNHDLVGHNLPDFVDPGRVSADVTHAQPANGDYGWESRMQEDRERKRRTRVQRGSWIDEEMDKHNIV